MYLSIYYLTPTPSHPHTHTPSHTGRFCRGCPIVCDDSAIGNSSPYVAIDWDVNILHLKYQSIQERVRGNYKCSIYI